MRGETGWSMSSKGSMMAPLERLVLPAHLDGSLTPRGSLVFPCKIEANNDLEAIELWISETAKTASTIRSYRLQAERCLLWATITLGKPLSGIDDSDICNYAAFLLNPCPREQWVSIGMRKRSDASWRPFRSPLSPRSSEHALGILYTLFEWMHTSGYIRENPWTGPAVYKKITKKSATPALATERRANVTSVIEWTYIKTALDELKTGPDSLDAARSEVVLYLAYFGDLKPGEICALRTSSISVLASDPAPVWKIRIQDRPTTTCEIILFPPLQRVLQNYLDCRGIVLDAGVSLSDYPLIASSRCTPDRLESDSNLSDSSALAFTRQVFSRAGALAQANGDVMAARRLSVTSINWLRHALEVHSVQMDASGTGCWHLLGACWLAPAAFRAYLPKRDLSVEFALQSFEELKKMWSSRSGRNL